MSRPTWTSRPDTSLAVAIEVLRHGPISRVDIARRLELSPGSLTRLTRPLLSSGLIREVGDLHDGSVGRPRQLLDVDASSRHFVGIKLRENEIVAALTDFRGEIVRSTSGEIATHDPEAVADGVASVISSLAGQVEVSGIGIGLGGSVRDQAVVVRSPYFDWTDVDLSALVAQRTGIHTLVDNDVVAFTTYQYWFAEGRDVSRFAVVTLGVATGYGLVVNGDPVVDDDYGLGLVNHWPLDPGGPMCERGHRGCVASILNSDSIAARVSDALRAPVTYEDALTLAREGQPAARTIIAEAGSGLGRLLAAICNLTLPERIIIAGEGVELAAIARDSIAAGLAGDRDPEATTPPIVLASGDNVEWCRGAAMLAIQDFVLGS